MSTPDMLSESQTEEGTRVDLVVISATNPTMAATAAAVSDAVENAIQTADAAGLANLRVAWFGIEEIWPDTKFTQTHRAYLQAYGIADKETVIGHRTFEPAALKSDGAAAILDMARHFDWRPNTQRAIFFLGDEALNGGNPQADEDVEMVDLIIKTAKKFQINVFTYFGLSDNVARETISQEYARMAWETGGRSYEAPLASNQGFESVLADVICLSVAGDDGRILQPDICPLFELHWGDGPRDQLETSDTETLQIVARNPYEDITLKDVTIYCTHITNTAGVPPNPLPDDTPSVETTPSKMIHFGDLPPMNSGNSVYAEGIARDVVLATRRARGGNYHYNFDYGFSVELPRSGVWQSPLRLVTPWWRWLLWLLPLLLLLLCCCGFWLLWPPIIADPNGPYFEAETRPITFDGSGSNSLFGITEYAWDFGDGSAFVGMGATPVYTYPDGPMEFTVTLTVTDRLGRSDRGTTKAIIHNLPPHAEANGPYTCFVSEKIPLLGQCSDPSPVDMQSLTCEWADFSGITLDDATVEGNSVNTGGVEDAIISQPTYTCPARPGDLTVILTATDKDGASHQDTAIVTVKPPTTTNKAPKADFYVYLIDKDHLTYGFNATASSDPEGEPLIYHWDFGDGKTEDTEGKVIHHPYELAGVYTVTLTVTNSQGLSDSKMISIQVKSDP